LLPWRSWINGNTVYFPQINETTGLNTGDAEELNKIAKATDNHLLTSVSLGEVLEQNGKTFLYLVRVPQDKL
jgi:hypothetical protein